MIIIHNQLETLIINQVIINQVIDNWGLGCYCFLHCVLKCFYEKLTMPVMAILYKHNNWRYVYLDDLEILIRITKLNVCHLYCKHVFVSIHYSKPIIKTHQYCYWANINWVLWCSRFHHFKYFVNFHHHICTMACMRAFSCMSISISNTDTCQYQYCKSRHPFQYHNIIGINTALLHNNNIPQCDRH